MGMADPPKPVTCRNCGKEESPYFAHPSLQCIATLRAENERLKELVGDAVKYIVEDKAVTPRATRLARWVDRARAALKGGA